MIRDKTIEITEGGVRLDAALLHAFPTTTRAFVKEAIASGAILIAEADSSPRRAPKGLKLKGGEQIVIHELLEAADNLVTPIAGPLSLAFEDEAILAFDKPAGMPVQPLTCRETGTLMNAVVARYPECRPLGDLPLMAGALHRIDADTSGLVLVARTAAAFENLRAQFAAQTVKKTYLALVEGSVAVGGTLENDLVHDPTLPFCRMIDKSRVRANGRFQISDLKLLHAVTSFRPIGHTTVENEERTLLEVTIFTGVTHQIRAQLALAGLHIVNDRLYGAFAVENQTGHCLHALAAAFAHPVSGDPVEIRTAYPDWATSI
ncbi:MAG: RluA family pseudouridine synthase [Kiritimatiellae bacterium]|nr:RluA family pseudouridine synthase [Kiritimatiellia bacterium]